MPNLLTTKYKNGIIKTWNVIKEVIGKAKLKNKSLPRRLIINGTETFNKYFSNIGENLTWTIRHSLKQYESVILTFQ